VEIEQAKVVKRFVTNATEERGRGRHQCDRSSGTSGCGGHWSMERRGERWKRQERIGERVRTGQAGDGFHGESQVRLIASLETRAIDSPGSTGSANSDQLPIPLSGNHSKRNKKRRRRGCEGVRSSAFGRGNTENGKPEFPENIVFATSGQIALLLEEFGFLDELPRVGGDDRVARC
jgi:hypothetical protein